MRRILVIGSVGQLGSELVPDLEKIYGKNNVIASDIKIPDDKSEISENFVQLDVLNKKSLEKIINDFNIDTIFNMASVLSAHGEKAPLTAWDVNLNGLLNVLEIGNKYNIKRIIWPSSIAAFGPTTPRINTPNETILSPTTMYGITKVTGELLVNYYFKKHGLDTRSMRLPGVISSKTFPEGGTTDYAVEIFYGAIKQKKYISFLSEDTILPMMYVNDCIKCMIDLLEVNSSKLKRRVYNVTSMSFSVGELVAEIKKHIPEFVIDYRPDFRQEIADSWPKSIDDTLARQEWGWNPKYDLASMTKDMIEKLSQKLKE
jgi:nucleoside-diphosphate-sugar epimerase